MARADRVGQRVRVGQRAMALGRAIKSGGAGTIYRLPDAPDQVAKIYHPQIERGDYAHKIEAMLELAPRLPAREFGGQTITQIAWPQDKIFDRGGRFIGFAMPLLDMGSTEELELMLQARQARAAGLNPSLGVKMTLAANLASVISSLHRQKHYLVDLKPVNLRFYRDSLYIALLDCDGFSVQGHSRRFPAEQFTPDYLAPEFQGRGVKPGKGREQDLFALAVIVFRLLNFGIHPFTGKPTDDRVPTDIPARIRVWLYAYGRQPHPQLAPSPVSAHEAMPRELRDLFDRAFASTDRPSAAAWADALSVYARRDSGRIVVCSKNHGHQHFAGQPCGECARERVLAASRRHAGARRKKRERRQQKVRQRVRQRTAAQARVAGNTARATGRRRPARPASRSGQAASAAAAGDNIRLFVVSVVVVTLVLMGAVSIRGCSTSDPSSRRTKANATAPVQQEAPSEPPTTLRQARASVPDESELEADIDATVAAVNSDDPERFRARLETLARRTLQHPRPRRSSVREYRDLMIGAARLPQADRRPGETMDRLKTRIEGLKSIVDDDPYAAMAAAEAGKWLLLLGERESAQHYYRQAIWADPTVADAWYGLGVTCINDDPDRTVALMTMAYATAEEVDGLQMRMLAAVYRLVGMRYTADDAPSIDALDERARALVEKLEAALFKP